jgi:ubiquitin carboxyl-terminal hydrolase 36/42
MNSFSTVIQDIFGVQLQSMVVCGKCRNKTSTEYWESIWSVSINSDTTLLQFLTEFCKPELLCGDNAYKCLTCTHLVQATRSYHLIKVSPIITIHLKRFSYDKYTHTTSKIKTFISCPELLDLAPYFDENSRASIRANKQDNALIYQLYAVVVHLGEAPTSGHIFAYIRSPDGLWYKANDNYITKVDINQVLTNKDAYMLFYSQAPKSKLVFNKTTTETNTTPLSPTSSSIESLSPLKTHENKRTNNHQYLVSL